MGHLVGVLSISTAQDCRFYLLWGLQEHGCILLFHENESTGMTFNNLHSSRWKVKGWLLTPCWITWACAALSAGEVTPSASGSVSPSWATTRGPTTTRAAAPPAASSCPAAGGLLGSWALCEEIP